MTSGERENLCPPYLALALEKDVILTIVVVKNTCHLHVFCIAAIHQQGMIPRFILAQHHMELHLHQRSSLSLLHCLFSTVLTLLKQHEIYFIKAILLT